MIQDPEAPSEKLLQISGFQCSQLLNKDESLSHELHRIKKKSVRDMGVGDSSGGRWRGREVDWLVEITQPDVEGAGLQT